MTSVVSAPLVSCDEEPRVDLVLRGGRMGPLLAERLGLAPASSHVLDAKYEPGASCTVLHQLGSELITVRLSLDGDDPSDGRGVVVAPDTRAFRFPDDPSLGGLAAAMDPVWLGPRLGEALGTDLRIHRISFVRYRPAKRATLRVEGWSRTADGQRVRRVLFAKIYHRATKAAAVYDEARRLVPWAAAREDLGLAPAVAFLADVPMVVHEGVTGTPLDALLRRGEESALARAGAALAALHRAPLVSARERSIDAELARFGRRAAAIERVAPAVGEQLGAVATALVAARPTVEPAPVGPGPRRLQAQPVPDRRGGRHPPRSRPLRAGRAGLGRGDLPRHHPPAGAPRGPRRSPRRPPAGRAAVPGRVPRRRRC